MKKIMLFEQYIKEFVDNSKIQYEGLTLLEEKVKEIMMYISTELSMGEDDLMDTYSEIENLPTFKKINDTVNTYFGTENSLYDNMNKLDIFIKEMREQYNMVGVTYDDKDITTNIDFLVSEITPLIISAINKISGKHSDTTSEQEVEVYDTVLESLKTKKAKK